MDNIPIDENIAYHKELISLYEQEKKAILGRIKYLDIGNIYPKDRERHSTEIYLEIIGLKQRLLDVKQSINTQNTWLKELKERKEFEKKAKKDKKDKKDAKVIPIMGGKY